MDFIFEQNEDGRRANRNLEDLPEDLVEKFCGGLRSEEGQGRILSRCRACPTFDDV